MLNDDTPQGAPIGVPTPEDTNAASRAGDAARGNEDSGQNHQGADNTSAGLTEALAGDAGHDPAIGWLVGATPAFMDGETSARAPHPDPLVPSAALHQMGAFLIQEHDEQKQIMDGWEGWQVSLEPEDVVRLATNLGALASWLKGAGL